jgi:hypothetical protein
MNGYVSGGDYEGVCVILPKERLTEEVGFPILEVT